MWPPTVGLMGTLCDFQLIALLIYILRKLLYRIQRVCNKPLYFAVHILQEYP